MIDKIILCPRTFGHVQAVAQGHLENITSQIMRKKQTEKRMPIVIGHDISSLVWKQLHGNTPLFNEHLEN